MIADSFHANRKLFKYQQVCVGMATKNISITEEAYMRLASLRRGKESFSEIINRVTQKKQLMDFAGILSKKTADRVEQHIQERRAGFDKEREQRRKELLQALE